MDGMTIAVIREGLDLVTEAVLSKLWLITWSRCLEHWAFLEICRSDERERGDTHTYSQIQYRIPVTAQSSPRLLLQKTKDPASPTLVSGTVSWRVLL